ncbi:MAG TPA: S9 family peptidase [Azospirillaceae bacterium]|nr:S9 family peptidase [Azospirillaceae bacterium]
MPVRYAVASAVLALLAVSTALADPPAAPPVEAYAHPPNMSQPSFSPDGTRIAYLAPIKGRQHLVIRKLGAAPGERPSILAPSDSEIGWFDWVNEERLLIGAYVNQEHLGPSRRVPFRVSRLIAANADGTDFKVLLMGRGSRYVINGARVLQFVDREHVLVPYPADANPDPDVIKLNVYTGKWTVVAKSVPDVSSYVPDPSGRIRIATVYHDRSQTEAFLLRPSEKEPFVRFRKVDPLKDPSFAILGFSEDPNRIYVGSAHEGDRMAIYPFDLTTRDFAGPRLLEDARYDISGSVVQRGVVTAFAWTDDLPNLRWIDPQKQKLQETLDKAVPGSRELISDQTADGRYTLVASFSAKEPITYRLFDRQTKEFSFFGDTYPDIPAAAIGERRALSYTARDGLEIPAYLTLPPGRDGRNLPFIVLPHGGPFARDTQVFDTLSQFLASRGYAVLQPNFRGSTGFGAKFSQAGEREWGGKMQDDVTDGVRWAISQGIADAGRVCIVGWSYGGYAALMGLVKTPELYKCAVATAPVANLMRLYDELDWSGGALARGLYFGDDRDAMRPISPVHNAEAVNAPVLLVHGTMDVQAYVQQSRDMVSALKKAGKPHEYLEIEGMDHSPRTTEQMVKVLSAWERFLKAHLGAGS